MKDVEQKVPDAVTDRRILKIYGERNTGTNYLTELFRRNTDVDILTGKVPRSDVRSMMTRHLRVLMPVVADHLHEWARDRYFEATFNSNLGWKHMSPAPDRMSARTLQNVRFLIVVKNPYAWLLSLYARPYHVGGKDRRFESFLERHLPVMEVRENIGADPLQPVEVWNRKVRGYLELMAVAQHAQVLRYEDVLADEVGTLRQAAAALGLPLLEGFEGVSHGVKEADRARPQADYVDYYLHERWRDKLTVGAVERINALLDPRLMRRMGYEIIDPVSHVSSTAAGTGGRGLPPL